MSWLGIIFLVILLTLGSIIFILRQLIKKMFFFSTKNWDNTPKDKLIVHCIGRGKCIPNPSPFVLKLETYLRMSNIPYEIDEEDSFGPTGKTPWITLNGTHVTDTQLIIEFLNKKFKKDLSGRLTKEERAIASTIRIMIEEHTFWGLVQWRWIGGIRHIKKIMNLPAHLVPIISFIMGRRVKAGLWAQGIGRHSFETMVQIICNDLRNLSIILGNKKYLMGNEPCEEDCAIFAMISSIVWAGFESPYEKLINDELHNLKEYCFRMKEKYWSDWDELCTNSKKIK